MPRMSLKPVAAALAQVLKQPVGVRRRLHRRSRREGGRSDEGRRRRSASKTRASIQEEEKNDPAFVDELAKLGDIYVNDAFSAAHRAHASTEGLGHKLPAYAGRTMQAELEALDKALGKPEEAGDRDRRRRQGLDQARPAGKPRHQGRRAGDRRRHGQHLPPRAGRRRRQVAVREGPGRHRARIMAKAEKPTARSSCRSTRSSPTLRRQRAVARLRPRRDPGRRHDPRRRPAIDRARSTRRSTMRRRWCGTARSAPSR